MIQTYSQKKQEKEISAKLALRKAHKQVASTQPHTRMVSKSNSPISLSTSKHTSEQLHLPAVEINVKSRNQPGQNQIIIKPLSKVKDGAALSHSDTKKQKYISLQRDRSVSRMQKNIGSLSPIKLRKVLQQKVK